jgi:hypothetical protein
MRRHQLHRRQGGRGPAMGACNVTQHQPADERRLCVCVVQSICADNLRRPKPVSIWESRRGALLAPDPRNEERAAATNRPVNAPKRPESPASARRKLQSPSCLGHLNRDAGHALASLTFVFLSRSAPLGDLVRRSPGESERRRGRAVGKMGLSKASPQGLDAMLTPAVISASSALGRPRRRQARQMSF